MSFSLFRVQLRRFGSFPSGSVLCDRGTEKSRVAAGLCNPVSSIAAARGDGVTTRAYAHSCKQACTRGCLPSYMHGCLQAGESIRLGRTVCRYMQAHMLTSKFACKRTNKLVSERASQLVTTQTNVPTRKPEKQHARMLASNNACQNASKLACQHEGECVSWHA